MYCSLYVYNVIKRTRSNETVENAFVNGTIKQTLLMYYLQQKTALSFLSFSCVDSPTINTMRAFLILLQKGDYLVCIPLSTVNIECYHYCTAIIKI